MQSIELQCGCVLSFQVDVNRSRRLVGSSIRMRSRKPIKRDVTKTIRVRVLAARSARVVREPFAQENRGRGDHRITQRVGWSPERHCEPTGSAPDDRLGVPHLFIVGERRTVCSTAGAYHRRLGLNAQLRTGHRDPLARTQLRSPRRSAAGERRCSMTFAQLPSSWVPAWRNIDIRGWPPTRAAPIIGPARRPDPLALLGRQR
jgi:hypothetical protein